MDSIGEGLCYECDDNDPPDIKVFHLAVNLADMYCLDKCKIISKNFR